MFEVSVRLDSARRVFLSLTGSAGGEEGRSTGGEML
jgi:hypothetical protein